MIIEWFLNVIYGIVALLLTPFELVTFPIGATTGIIELFANASIFVPIGTLGICLGIWLLLQSATFVISIANWIIAKIPTID